MGKQEIGVDHIFNPRPIEQEPGLVNFFVEQVRKIMPLDLPPPGVSAVYFEYEISDEQSLTVTAYWSEGDSGGYELAYAAKLCEQIDTDNGIYLETELQVGVNTTTGEAFSSEYQLQAYHPQADEGRLYNQDDEDDSDGEHRESKNSGEFDTSQLATINFAIEAVLQKLQTET